MYINIDRDNLKITHKHRNQNVVLALDWIENPHIKVSVTTRIDQNFLGSFTDMELKILCRNCYDVDHKDGRVALRDLIFKFADALPENDVDEREARIQAELLPSDNEIPFRYVKGSFVPSQNTDLWRHGARPPPPQQALQRTTSVAGTVALPWEQASTEAHTERSVAANKDLASVPKIAYNSNIEFKILSYLSSKENTMPDSTESNLQELTPTNQIVEPTPAAVKAAEKLRIKEELKAQKAADKIKAAEAKAEVAALKAKAKTIEKMPEQNGVKRPKDGTLCGQAWKIFDDISAKNKQPCAISEALVVSTASNLNPSNVRAEYARWRKFHGIAGRVKPLIVAAPATEAPVPPVAV